MKIFEAMRSRRTRRRRWGAGDRAEAAFARVSLQLQVLVAMANADGEIRGSEYERLHAIAERLSTADTRDRVKAQLQLLFAAPPTDEDVLRSLIAAGGNGRMNRRLVEDITELAEADAVIDPREERLLRLMSAIGGTRPLSLRAPKGAPLDATEQELLRRLEREVTEEQAAARERAEVARPEDADPSVAA